MFEDLANAVPKLVRILQDFEPFQTLVLFALLAERENRIEPVYLNIPDNQNSGYGLGRLHDPARIQSNSNLLGMQGMKQFVLA